MDNLLEQDGFKQIGRIPIDSGLVMIGDPCYTLPDDGVVRKKTRETRDWMTLVAKMNGKSTITIHDLGDDSSCLIITSTGGDGTYPVYVKKEKGVPVGLFVDFTRE